MAVRSAGSRQQCLSKRQMTLHSWSCRAIRFCGCSWREFEHGRNDTADTYALLTCTDRFVKGPVTPHQLLLERPYSGILEDISRHPTSHSESQKMDIRHCGDAKNRLLVARQAKIDGCGCEADSFVRSLTQAETGRN